jgi:hypothetical protein
MKYLMVIIDVLIASTIILIIVKMKTLPLLLLATLPLLCLSWWDVGHMLTAAIAEAKLLEEDPYAAVHFR